MQEDFDVAIIGGGASGFFSACQLIKALPKVKIVILEKSGKVLSKVRISGGGRCNVTHNATYNSELVKNYPNGKNFLKKVLKHFSVSDTVKWFESREVPLKIEADGRMFPLSDNSQSIIEALENNSIRKGVKLITSFEVIDIKFVDDLFTVSSKREELIRSKFVIVASGGYPKESQFSWVKNLGHSIQTPVPSLFTFNIPVNGLAHLQGLSVADAKVQIVGENLSYNGPLLITHWGISGPSVLKLSAWGARMLQAKNYDFSILINWVGSIETESSVINQINNFKDTHPKKLVVSNPLFNLPARLWAELIQRALLSTELQYQDLGKKSINRMLEVLFRLKLDVSGKTTYKEEFVTSGGVSLNQIKNNMESMVQPKLYFTGEVLDIDGITGGFNFQAAWSTAYVAANDIASKFS